VGREQVLHPRCNPGCNGRRSVNTGGKHMSVLASIIDKIFPPDHPANTLSGATIAPATAPPGPSIAPPTNLNDTAAASQPPVTPLPTVDIAAILDTRQSARTDPLDWRTSIVDLLKLLNLDSSLEVRKLLAAELAYPENQDDSDHVDVWLHKEILKRLARNGGEVPASLKT
jgi:hypothetical protein